MTFRATACPYRHTSDGVL